MYLTNTTDKALSPFTDYITEVTLMRGEEVYSPFFSEANPSGSDYAEALKDIDVATEVEAFMKFEIPSELSVSDGFTLCFKIDGTSYSCDIK